MPGNSTPACRVRLLYVTDVYFPRVNGVSTSIYTFRRELQAIGHEVVVVAPRYPQQSSATEAGIVRMPSLSVPLDPEDRIMRGLSLRKLRALLAGQDFDLVHVQTPFAAHYAGLRIARALGLPCVATYHTYFEEYLHHYLPLLPRAMVRAFARAMSCRQGNQIDALVVPSRAMHATLSAYGVRTPMTILPTGISRDALAGGDGAAFRQRHGIPAQRPLLVHVGRVAFEKNIEFLLRVHARVCARHRDALLLIAGEGPALAHLKSIARRNGLADSVRFVGYLDRASALLDCYRAGDAFVFASRTETQGLVLLEAMALGLPVVAIAEMGAIDILEAGKGALVSAFDEQAFADRVCQLLDSADLRRNLGAEGSAYAAQWDAARQAQRLQDFYGAVLRTAAHRRPIWEPAPTTEAGPPRRGCRA
jgi:glycosyltransferase involved in cell wall biosynthesis